MSLNLFAYKLPFFQQQSIYFKETLKNKSYNSFSFKIDGKDYTINASSQDSTDPLIYVLSNIFINHDKSLNKFVKKHNVDKTKSYYTLFDDAPVIVYGNEKKINSYDIDNLVSEIWLDNEQAYPVKVVFKLNENLIIAEFSEYHNQKYKYMFPTTLTLIVNGEKKVYQLSNFK
jgi:hypothetical protein